MAFSKIIAESMDLTDTYAFTGTVTGAGESNTPYFYAHTDDGQSISAGTNTKIAYNTEVLDSDSGYDPSTNHRFTVPSGKGGIYFFSAQYRVNDSSDFGNCQIRFYKNGSEVMIHNLYHHHYESRMANIILNLNPGDYLETYAYLDNTYTLSSDYKSNYFYGYRVKAL